MTERSDIPKFKSEAEEAEWWDRHREDTAKWLEDAVANGRTTNLAAVMKRARRASSSESNGSAAGRKAARRDGRATPVKVPRSRASK
jgi:hypothetical protein